MLFYFLKNKILTTADPIATPPAVAAIWAISPGCFGCACMVDNWLGGGWCTTGGGGAGLKIQYVNSIIILVRILRLCTIIFYIFTFHRFNCEIMSVWFKTFLIIYWNTWC